MARIYREHLHTMSRERCDALDAAMADVGITWMSGRDVVYEDTDAITGDLAAELVGRPESVIRQWACIPHPDDPTRMLLPRFGWDDKRRTYLVGQLREAARIAESEDLVNARTMQVAPLDDEST